MSVIKRLSLYEFALWGRDLVSALERVRIIEVYFIENIWNFSWTKGTVRNREASVLEVSVRRGSTVFLKHKNAYKLI